MENFKDKQINGIFKNLPAYPKLSKQKEGYYVFQKN